MAISTSPQLMGNVRRTPRKMRSPTHTFNVEYIPFALMPIVIAPVLPGETLKSALFQSRCVTDPILNSEIGWWKEHFFFYVKVRDIMDLSTYRESADRSLFEDQFVNPDVDTTNITHGADAASVTTGRHTANISARRYVSLCLQVIVEKYFRDADEVASTAAGSVNGSVSGYQYYLRKLIGENGLHSLVLDAEYDTPSDPGITIGGDGLFTMREMQEAWNAWQQEVQYGFTDLDFAAYQRAHGVAVPEGQAEPGKPELLRYVRKYYYPANTVHSGGVSTAISCSTSFRVDKDRYFREPGFIMGISSLSPKVYMKGQTRPLVDFMTQMKDWGSTVSLMDPYGMMKNHAASAGPVPGITGDDYWFDFRDLFVHGDQFIGGYALTETDKNLVALPTSAGQKKYAPIADIEALFSGTGSSGRVREDGAATFNILGKVTDYSART